MRQDYGAGGPTFAHFCLFLFSQAKKVSEVLEEGNSLGLFEVAHDTHFCKDSNEEEELEQ